MTALTRNNADDGRRPRLGARLRALCDRTVTAWRRSWHGYALPAILPENPAETADRWLVLVINSTSPVRMASSALLARGLMLRGWHLKIVYEISGFERFADADRGISGALVPIGWRLGQLTREPAQRIGWNIDLKAGCFEALGMNFYKLVENTISNFTRLYHPDYDDPEHRDLVHNTVQSACDMLEVARRIEQAADAGKRITVVTCEAHAAPNGILREYLTHPDRQDKVAVYLLAEAYTNYYRARHYDVDVMLTRSADRDCFQAYYATKAEFERWYDRLPAEAHTHIRETVRPIIESTTRRKRHTFRHDPAHMARIEEARAAGKPVYCLFAHVFYDRCPHDEVGPFTSMPDWITKTVEAFQAIDGLLLLKPHPGELATNHLAPKEYLSDLVGGRDRPDNVLLLGANEFLANEIYPLIDAAIVWQSTAFVEMSFFGVPSLYCGPPSAYSTPLGIAAPQTTAQFDDALRRLPENQPSEEFRQRAVAVTYLLNCARIIPITLITRLPDWLTPENRVVSPVKLARMKLLGTCLHPEFADVVEADGPGALGPYATEADHQAYG